MMGRRKPLDVFLMIGAILSFTGLVTTVVGIGLAFSLDDVEIEGNMPPWFMAAMFVVMGLVSLGFGVFLLTRGIRSASTRRRLVGNGRYVWAEVVDVYMDWSVRINDRPCYRVMLRQGEPGSREFTSGPFSYNSLDWLNSLASRRLKVYVDDGSEDYYIDFDSVA